jgi:Phosphodiester glycosidase
MAMTPETKSAADLLFSHYLRTGERLSGEPAQAFLETKAREVAGAGERKSAEAVLFAHYLRTGERLHGEAAERFLELKFNPHHDPDDGRFTFAPGGGSLAPRQRPIVVAASRALSRSSSPSHATNRPAPSVSLRQGSVGRPVVATAASRGSVVRRTTITPPQELRARIRSMPKGRSELHRMPEMDVVIFGPGVSLSPVPVMSLESFDSAVARASRMRDLDAVITGPQFDLTLAGSETLHGQAVVGGRVYGRSAPSLYYFATVSGPDGTKHIEIGKGDPPPSRIEVGIGGGVPMLLGGKDVPGYNIAWNSHRNQPAKGKNIVAYNSTSNTLAIFVQKDGVRGQSLRQMVDYIKHAGYDSALMFDGSASTSLNYQGQQLVSPEFIRQPVIPLGIGFRSKR